MNIYLAARYSRYPEMQLIRSDLELLGHVVTSRWVNGAHQSESDDLEACARFASEDILDLVTAECVISFTEESRKPHSNRGGRHVEFGIAYAHQKKLIVVGHRENVFHALPDVQFYEDWASALASISLWKQA